MQQRVNAAPYGLFVSRPSDGAERCQLIKNALQQIGVYSRATGPPGENQADLLIRESTGSQRADHLIHGYRPTVTSNESKRLLTVEAIAQEPDLIAHRVISHTPHHPARCGLAWVERAYALWLAPEQLSEEPAKHRWSTVQAQLVPTESIHLVTLEPQRRDCKSFGVTPDHARCIDDQ
ncbi:hypothetical protein [Streptomyces torulosus]|uniref:hypothetical protein n=1 Tax=Streptomyces torulosus TaxID=68276 RepID=UPI0019D0ABC7|nr:hypothetical protein [Streptomyces torulosus]